MEKPIKEVEKLLGRKLDKMEKVIYDLLKDDDSYEFKNINGSLEGHKKK